MAKVVLVDMVDMVDTVDAVDTVDMVDNMLDNMIIVESISMMNMQKTFCYKAKYLLVDTSR